MLISGDFIALQKEKDFISGYDEEEPLVVWINIRNIVQLNCYDDGYELILPGRVTVIITSEAASELIKFMRKERDDKVKARLDLLKEDPAFKKDVKRYLNYLEEANDGNEE